jgi:hypothetical protein
VHEQVTLLASGRLMFHGARQDISPWFASLGYERLHGEESDWLLDLVATGFERPLHMYGNTFKDSQDIAAAATAFEASSYNVRICIAQYMPMIMPCC